MALTFKPGENFNKDDLLSRHTLFGKFNRYQVRHHRHNIFLMVGKPGSGKTYGAMYFAKEWQKIINGKDWHVKDNLALDAQTFYKLVNKALPGDVIIFDEIGALTGFNSRKSMSSENIALSSLFQTIRSRRLIIILTTPNFGYIDKSLRELIDFNFTAEHIDYETNLCRFKAQQLQLNPVQAKIYYHFPRVFVPGKGKFLMPHVYSSLPDQEQIDEYERMKTQYQDKLNKIIQGQLKRMTDKELGVTQLKPDERMAFELYQQEIPQLEIYERLGYSNNKGKRVLDTALLKMGIESKVCYAQKNHPNVGKSLQRWKEQNGKF